MKVVLFCGGFGMRMREYSEAIPKPMVSIGHRPILWHVMKYYAHYGHTDFILCLGWKSQVIKDYFLRYDECVSNDFVLSSGGSRIDLLNSDFDDWTITFVDTGAKANIGERLMAVRQYVEDDEEFLANYSDGLTDLHLPDLIDYHHRNDATATFLSVPPQQSFHAVDSSEAGCVNNIQAINDAGVWMNGGYFVLRNEVFDYMEAGDELVVEPFARLIEKRQLYTYKHNGFWGCMDTYKEKQQLDEMCDRGETPWEVWRRPAMPPLDDQTPLGPKPTVQLRNKQNRPVNGSWG